MGEEWQGSLHHLTFKRGKNSKAHTERCNVKNFRLGAIWEYVKLERGKPLETQ